MSRLIIKNLPPKTTEKTLSDLFSQCGEVTDAKLIRTSSGHSRRFGFVGLASETQAQHAVEKFDRTFIGSARISVEVAKPYGDESLHRPWSKYSKGSSAFAKRDKEKKKREREKGDEGGEGGEGGKKVKSKRPEVLSELSQIEEEEEFQQFLSLHENKNQVRTWADGAGGGKELKKNKEKKNLLNLGKTTRHEEGALKEKRSITSKREQRKSEVHETSGSEEVEEDEEEEEEEEKEEGETVKATSKATDMDYLRSKVVTNLTAEASEEETTNSDSSEEEDDSTDPETEDESRENSEETPDDQNHNEFSTTHFTLRMRGLPFRSTREDIETFFHPLTLADVRFTVDKDGRPSGRAYVDFHSQEDLEEALKRDGDCVGKRYIELFRDNGPQSWKREADRSDKRDFRSKLGDEEEEEEILADSGRLFLRNLSFTVTEDDLTKSFEQFGPLTEVTVPLDKNTNRSTGLGFVTFMLPEHAVKAYEVMDGQVFQGRLLHILPARPRIGGRQMEKEEDDDDSGTSYKKKKEKEQKTRAGSSHNWNMLFLGANSVIDEMSSRYSTSKSSILDPESDHSAAVRMALGETQLVRETREFLESEGVRLDVFEKKTQKRSSNVVLVKNLPHGTTRSELETVFSPFGSLHKVILPPAGVTALVEFLESSQAKTAFKRLAYTKFKHLPLYLEWAPMGAVVDRKKEKKREKEEGDSGGGTVTEGDEGVEEEEDDGEEEKQDEEGCILFVKNLSFSSNEEALERVFSKVKGLTKVEVAKKRNLKDPSHPLSMGYGFVEYSTPQQTQQALKELQHADLDGHQLELKLSNRSRPGGGKGGDNAERKRAKKKEQKSAKIMIRNIPFEASQREVRELFQTFGQLKTVRLPKKMAAMGRHRGFGFVEFMTKEDAKRAFDSLVYSTHLYGRRLVLEWAEGDESVEEIRKRTADHFHGLHGPATNVSSKRRKAELLLFGNSRGDD